MLSQPSLVTSHEPTKPAEWEGSTSKLTATMLKDEEQDTPHDA